MKIKEIRTWSKDLGTSRPYSIAYKTVDQVVNAFVEIELENGITGIGSANPSKMVVGVDVEDTIQQMTPENLAFLENRDIREFEQLVRESQDKLKSLTGVSVAVDIALYDVFTKYLDIPLWYFLGSARKSMATSVTIGIKNVEETLKEAREYHDMKFKILKVKTGLNAEEDAERIIKIHEEFPEMIVRVDANQGYTPSALSAFVKLSKGIPLDLIEQPFPTDSFLDDIADLGPEESKILVADESLKDAEDALNIIRQTEKCRIFNIKLMKTGGITTARDIAGIAKLSDIDLMWGCNDESAVSITAALHVALSYQHTKYIDLDGSLDVISDAVSGGFRIDDGLMSLTNEPGLGVQFQK